MTLILKRLTLLAARELEETLVEALLDLQPALPGFTPAGRMREASPPWQSAQPSISAADLCIVQVSLAEWHEMQPSDFAFCSS